jgi:hypothetical protein
VRQTETGASGYVADVCYSTTGGRIPILHRSMHARFRVAGEHHCGKPIDDNEEAGAWLATHRSRSLLLKAKRNRLARHLGRQPVSNPNSLTANFAE